MRKILSLTLALVLVMLVCPVFAVNAEEYTEPIMYEEPIYELEEQTPEISQYMHIDNNDYGMAEEDAENDEQAQAPQIQPFANPPTIDDYNNVTAPSTANLTKEPVFASVGKFSEYISPYSGEMMLAFNDLNLKGRNGLDLNIGRTYQTSQAYWGDRQVSVGANGALYDSISYSTYLQNRYNLGPGWGFSFPSVEVRGFGDNEELYYHTGDGNVFHVNFNSPNLSNLDNYTTEDIQFRKDNNSTFFNGQTRSKYFVKMLDGTRQYFGADGRLLGIVDRFNNEIKFEHIEKPVSNIVPNGLFERADTIGLWTASPKYNQTTKSGFHYSGIALCFESDVNKTGVSANAMSTYISVMPEKDYEFNGSFEMASTFSGQANLTLYEYNANKQRIGAGTILADRNYFVSGTESTKTVGLWFNTNTRYVRIELDLTNAKGKFDCHTIALDRKWPLISKITDTIGRTAIFTYGSYLYDESANHNQDITVTVTAPGESGNRFFRYTRERELVNSLLSSDSNSTTEDRYFWAHTKFYEQGQLFGDYRYSHDLRDQPQKQQFSFLRSNKNPNDASMTFRPLLKELYTNNTRFKYGYKVTTKWLGLGYYETAQVNSRSEAYKKSGNTYTAPNKARTFNYGILNADNETGYPSSPPFDMDWYDYSSSISQDNKLKTTFHYTGNRLNEKEIRDITNSSVSQQ